MASLIVRPMTDFRGNVQIDADSLHTFVEPENNEETTVAFFTLAERPKEFFVKLVASDQKTTVVGIVLHKLNLQTTNRSEVELLIQKNRVVWMEPAKWKLCVSDSLQSDMVTQINRLERIFIKTSEGYLGLIESDRKEKKSEAQITILSTKPDKYTRMANRLLDLVPKDAHKQADVPKQENHESCCLLM